MKRLMVGAALLVAGVAGAISAQTEQDLRRAAEKYKAAIADAERALRASLDKAAMKAKDKAALAKIAYETERFDKAREVPTCVPTKSYLRARDAAVAALASSYERAVKARRAAKDLDKADELEGEYAKLVAEGRGFGLAIPDPSRSPLVVIRSKQGGFVLDAVDPKGSGSQVVLAKHVRGKPSQLWRLERGDDGVAFRSAAGSLYLHVPAGSRDEGTPLVLWDAAARPPNKHFSWKADERLREVVFLSRYNELALTAKETTEKGVIKTLLTQEKQPTITPATQLWKIEEQN